MRFELGPLMTTSSESHLPLPMLKNIQMGCDEDLDKMRREEKNAIATTASMKLPMTTNIVDQILMGCDAIQTSMGPRNDNSNARS